MSVGANLARDERIDGALTLDRGLKVLELLAKSREPLSAAEIADFVDMSRQGAYRILGTLCDHHLAVKVSRGKYRYGTGILRLTQGAFNALESLVRPRLTDLAAHLGAAAHCAVVDGSDAVTLTVAEPPDRTFRFCYERGSRYALTQGASGIAILSSRDPVDGEAEAVSQAREMGYAVTIGQLTPGAVGVAVPLRDSDGKGIDASIGVVSIRELDVHATAELVKAVAAEISSGL